MKDGTAADVPSRRAGPDAPPVTPDGRYIVVRGRLWRRADPRLDPASRERLVGELMEARRAVGRTGRAGDPAATAAARALVDAAKRGLGERGPVWWDDGAPDLNRHMARNTPYAAWFTMLASVARSDAAAPNDSPPGSVSRAGAGEAPGE